MSAPQRDSKTTLYEAALAAVKDRQEQDDQRRNELSPRPPRSSTTRVLLLLCLGAVAAVLLAWRPVWLSGPVSIPPETPAITAASLRLALLRERERVNDFVRIHGRLPATLREAGSPREDFQLQAGEAPGTFVLSGQAGDSAVALGSSEDPKDFLGNSLIRIRSRAASPAGGSGQ